MPKQADTVRKFTSDWFANLQQNLCWLLGESEAVKYQERLAGYEKSIKNLIWELDNLVITVDISAEFIAQLPVFKSMDGFLNRVITYAIKANPGRQHGFRQLQEFFNQWLIDDIIKITPTIKSTDEQQFSLQLEAAKAHWLKLIDIAVGQLSNFEYAKGETVASLLHEKALRQNGKYLSLLSDARVNLERGLAVLSHHDPLVVSDVKGGQVVDSIEVAFRAYDHVFAIIPQCSDNKEAYDKLKQRFAELKLFFTHLASHVRLFSFAAIMQDVDKNFSDRNLHVPPEELRTYVGRALRQLQLEGVSYNAGGRVQDSLESNYYYVSEDALTTITQQAYEVCRLARQQVTPFSQAAIAAKLGVVMAEGASPAGLDLSGIILPEVPNAGMLSPSDLPILPKIDSPGLSSGEEDFASQMQFGM